MKKKKILKKLDKLYNELIGIGEQSYILTKEAGKELAKQQDKFLIKVHGKLEDILGYKT